MKNMIYLGFLLAVILGCQSPDPSRVKKVAIQETQFRVPAEVGTTEDFASQSLDKCKYTNGYFYIDDYSNSFVFVTTDLLTVEITMSF